MRHALVVTQLIHEARSVFRADERQLADAPPEPEAPRGPGSPMDTGNRAQRSHRPYRSRWLATLFRRARVRAPGMGAESPGGGA